MKIIFLGGTYFSQKMLEALLEANADIRAVFSIPKKFEMRTKANPQTTQYNNTTYSDLDSLAKQKGIPSYIVSGGDNNLERYSDVITEIGPDIILVLGWFYFVPKKIRKLAKIATLGIHASLLPKYAGGSPLVWALIKGEEETGVTLFKMEDGIDTGDILAQKCIPIALDDDIKSLYDKVILEAKNILISGLSDLALGKAKFVPQGNDRCDPLPIRKPEDSGIDWNQSSIEIYNFVRAQTRPYPCAFSFIKNKKVKFLKVKPGSQLRMPPEKPGVLFLREGTVYIQTGNGVVEPTLVEVDADVCSLKEWLVQEKIQEGRFGSIDEKTE